MLSRCVNLRAMRNTTNDLSTLKQNRTQPSVVKGAEIMGHWGGVIVYH